jgi:hypothetical protein
MDYTTSNGIDFILEDSARIAPSTAETLIAGAKALRAGTADMVYAGFLGSEANLVCNRALTCVARMKYAGHDSVTD